MRTPARRRSTLQAEMLEDRSLPATWGIPWADSDHVSLSFAPDGTQTPLGSSNLTQSLGSVGTTAAWKREVLRAYQTWAAVADIDISVVADGGQPLGTLGAVQSDTRFGDIRIAAAPLSDGIVANTSPFTWTGTTHAGDLVFNSTQTYAFGNVAGKYDVYSVALHEAGHSFGLPDQTTDPTSVEYRSYRYIAGGLPAVDVAAIRAMYGTRAPDVFDAAVAGGNDAASRASSMPKPTSNQYFATGDLSTATDVDYYRFSLGALQGLLGATVRLRASGLSLLAPKVTVFNSAGQVVGSASSTDPMNNDLSIKFGSLLGGTYTIKVDRADAAFGVGGYVLGVDTGLVSGLLNIVGGLLAPVTDNHTNDSLSDARMLEMGHATDDRFDAIYRGAIEDYTDVDSYKVNTAKYDAADSSVSMNVMVWGLDVNPVNPRIRIYDKNSRPVAFQVLANDKGLFSIQVPNVAAADDYYIQVLARDTSGSNRTGGYFLGVDYNQLTPTTFDAVAGGTVSGTTAATDALVVPEAKLFQFALSADPLQSESGGVTMTVYDGLGNVAFSMSAAAGQPPVTAIRYLKAGAYTVRYSSTNGGTATINYGLYVLELSDPVGTMPTSTSTSPGSPPPPSAPPSYTYSSSSSTTRSYGYVF